MDTKSLLARYCEVIQTEIRPARCTVKLFRSQLADQAATGQCGCATDAHCQMSDKQLAVKRGDLLLVATGSFYQVNRQFELSSICLNLSTSFGTLISTDGKEYGIPIYGAKRNIDGAKQFVVSSLSLLECTEGKAIPTSLVSQSDFLGIGDGAIYCGPHYKEEAGERHEYLYQDVNVTKESLRSMRLSDLVVDEP